jgi:Xaa-Pro aminopeptidase
MKSEFFQANRRALLEKLNSGALIVMTGYEEMQQVNDAAAPFEQEANFWYVTGVEAPGWWVILDGATGSEWLVSPELSETQKVFDGGADVATVKLRSGIKTVIDRDEALRRLRQLTKHHSVAYTTEQPKWLHEHAHFQLNTAQSELKKTLERIFQGVTTCNRQLAELRTIKRPEEIAAIKRAVKVTADALEAMKTALGGAKYEYELQAILDYEIRRSGARHAYAPIVAHGLNACTLHYIANDDKLNKRGMVLLDVGARVDGYAADISRTYTLGKPTKRQQALHGAVVSAQAEIVSILKPGLSFAEYEESVETIMKHALDGLGLDTQRYRDYFPHAVSHGLGVDVHDALAGHDTLQPGMVLTVEPGLYIREEGLGVRIEDDVLITESGHINLSSGISTEL